MLRCGLLPSLFYVPVPKKGDLTNPFYYRGISLIPIAAKIYNKLILNHLIPHVDPILRMNQNGFRKGRSTIAQILTLRRIIEEMNRHNKVVVICFVDFKKAFDLINREAMFEILPLYGIPDEVVKAIRSLYTNTKATVITPDGETDFFNIEAGVLQGDTLAPFLFIIVLDYILRLSFDQRSEKGLQLHPRRSRRHPAQYITDLDYADDLAIVSEHVRDAESLLHALETSASLVGLHYNDKKTEYITSSSEPSSITSIHGKNIKRVDDFKYLGSFIMDSYKDFKIRKACNALGKIWRSNLDNNLKVRLFRAAVEPILLYGAETWTLTLKQQQRLDGTYTNLLRRVQNIHWSSHATLEEIYRELPPISARLAKRRLLFAGHCCRAEGEAVSGLLLWSPSHLPVRSRRLTFPKVISRDAGLDVEDLRAAMCDREVWRDVVRGISAEAEG